MNAIKSMMKEMINKILATCLSLVLLGCGMVLAQDKLPPGMAPAVGPKSEEAKPWVFWYWMHAASSEEGIVADLQAMKEMGIAGAYLAPIKGKTDPPLFEPVVETMTRAWWDRIRFTLDEADKRGLKIALLPNDGFATAGGSWITPELSMQKVVWKDTVLQGGKELNLTLPLPEHYQDYYRDLATYAFPVPALPEMEKPKVSTSTGAEASFLAEKGNTRNFSSGESCWIQYTFSKPITYKAIQVSVSGFNYEAGRLIIQTSDDGIHFQEVTRLVPPRAGWLDWDAPSTHALNPITSRYFRFVYDPVGSEPGGEDLDAAKWKPSLKLSGIQLIPEARIHQFEGKSGLAWRIAEPTTDAEASPADCIQPSQLLNLSAWIDSKGVLKWKAPKGRWRILRMGYTSTGHQNETAGNGKGLECDKFNPEAVQLQLQGWLQKAVDVAGPELASRVLTIFHVDSWECGSQNWSPVFLAEFKNRRGYDPLTYLPAMAGYPVESAEISERFLYDIRKTIAELMKDHFFKPIAEFTHQRGASFSAEATAPVMLGDGMAHFKEVDIPMGEFWLRSPSHDKMNDVLDAVSGAHIYGKNLVQAEAFTQIRMQWDEHPGNLKTLQDRNYALGVNRLVYHIYVHNPWMDRKPGMTLDGIGLYFQRDQTWWKPGKAWVDYAQRAQVMLQEGRPVADIAAFVGEEYPRRALLPHRLVSTLPGLFGTERVESEKRRLANAGLPMQKIAGVTTSANMVQPEYWVNALHGYAYDSFNPEVLLAAEVQDGRIQLPGGTSYGVLVLPAKFDMKPDYGAMSLEVLQKIEALAESGATILLGEAPTHTLGLAGAKKEEPAFRSGIHKLWDGPFEKRMEAGQVVYVKRLGEGYLVKTPYLATSLAPLGLTPDVVFQEKSLGEVKDMGYLHRTTGTKEIYFLTNQQPHTRNLVASFRVNGKVPAFYDAVTDRWNSVQEWQVKDGRTEIPLHLEPQASLFVVFEQDTKELGVKQGLNWPTFETKQQMQNPWKVQFDPAYGGPKAPITMQQLSDWSQSEDPAIRYYSGTAVYESAFSWNSSVGEKKIWLQLSELANIARIEVNGMDCGVLWTAPFRVDISKALKKGNNQVRIEVTNTWANRLIGDRNLPEQERITHTTAPDRFGDQKPLKAGLIGEILLLEEK